MENTILQTPFELFLEQTAKLGSVYQSIHAGKANGIELAFQDLIDLYKNSPAIVKAVNNHDILVEALERINMIISSTDFEDKKMILESIHEANNVAIEALSKAGE